MWCKLVKRDIGSGLNKADCLSRVHRVAAEVIPLWVGMCLLESPDAVCCMFVREAMSVCVCREGQASQI